MTSIIPGSKELPIDRLTGQFSLPWRRWLEAVNVALNAAGSGALGLATDITAIATALGSPDGTVANIPDQESLDVVIVGRNGVTVTGKAGVSPVYVELQPVEDSGVGTALLKITRDAYGRIEGTQAATTSDLTEGSNLYYTDERAQDAIAAAFAAGTQTGCTVTYNDASNSLSVAVTGSGGGTIPLASAFSVIGTGVTATDKTDRLQLALSTYNGSFRGLVKNLPATPYTVDCSLSISGVTGSAQTMICGIALSDGTGYRTLGIALSSAVYGPRIYHWASAAGVTSTAFLSNLAAPLYPAASLRVTDDGTTRKFYISQNGKDFALLYSEGHTVGITPTKCGMFIYNDYTSALDTKAAVTNYVVTGSVLGDAA